MNTRRLKASLAAFLLVSSLARAETGSGAGAEFQAPREKEKNVDQPRPYSYPKNTVDVKAGRGFEISLRSGRKSGYEWQLAGGFDKNILELVSSEYIADQGKAAGAGEKEVWTFKALKTGETTVSFRYVRRGEKEAVPARKEDYFIMVKE